MKIYHIYTYSLQETLSSETCAMPKGQPSSQTLIIKKKIKKNFKKNSAVTYSMWVKTKQNPNESHTTAANVLWQLHQNSITNIIKTNTSNTNSMSTSSTVRKR